MFAFNITGVWYLLVIAAFITGFLNKIKETYIPLLRASNIAVLLYEETFEQGEPFEEAHNKEVGTEHGLTLVENPVLEGSKAARFELRDTDPIVKNGKRSEVTIIKDKVGKEMWYSFAVYFPSEGYEKDREAAEIISQWKHRSEDGAGSPSTALRIKNDRFVLDTGYNTTDMLTEVNEASRQKFDLGQVIKNEWHEFVFHIVHTYEYDGLIEVWHNGKKVLTHKGGNYYNIRYLPKWKIGLYKSAFKYPGTSEVNRRVIFFDNVRVGNARASLTDMLSDRWKDTGNEK